MKISSLNVNSLRERLPQGKRDNQGNIQIGMNHSSYPISPYPVKLPRKDLRQMIRVVCLLHKLSQNIAYKAQLEKMLPPPALLNPGHDSVMMGYDFHLGPSGPKLIEVNSNAGGIWYACLSYNPNATVFPERLGSKLLKSFINEFALFSKNSNARPEQIVILDEYPQEQPLYAGILNCRRSLAYSQAMGV